MAEQLANNASSILDGSIDDSQTTLDVVDASLFPATGDFRILVEDELMLVTGVSTNTFTVTRGIEDTAPDSHADAEAVTHVLTADGLTQFVSENGGSGASIDAGAIGSRPSAGTAGNIYIPNGGPIFQRDNGVSWDSYGPVFKFTQPPVLASFTGVNTTGGSTSVAADQGGIISVTKPPTAGVNISMWVKSAPSTPYTIEAAMLGTISRTSNQPGFGLCFRDSADGGKPQAVSVQHTNVTVVSVDNYTALTSVSNMTSQNVPGMGLWWFRISDNGTDKKYWYSSDGITWLQIYAHGRTTNITPNQVGFFIDHQSGTFAIDMHMKLLSWKETTDNV